jgi:hypothetical protein
MMMLNCLHCKVELMVDVTDRAMVNCPACDFLFAVAVGGVGQIPTFAEEQSLPRVLGRRSGETVPYLTSDATQVADTSQIFENLPVPLGKILFVEVIDGPKDLAEVYRFTHGRMVFGRVDAEIILNDEKVSRKHAVIEAISRENIYLKDLASTNGTYLNGHRVTMKKIADGDVIRIGSVSLRFRVQDE